MERLLDLSKDLMIQALSRLDQYLAQPVKLIMGGGGAMVLAHGYPLSTTDLDAIPTGIELSELDPLVKKVADDLSLPTDWLNPYYSTFAHTLPSDYGTRLIEVFQGKFLSVQALSKEEMLIMKCFAHRQKDVGHTKALLKKKVDVAFVEQHIEALQKKRIPGADQALDFLDDIRSQVETGS